MVFSNIKGEPLISVVIPVFNRSELVKESINSVLNQTYTKIEIIIVDDNSDEEIELILKKEFPEKNIRYFRNKINMGVSFSRNVGIKQSDGDYISFLDSDDVIEKNKLELLIKKALTTDSDYIYGGWVWMDFEINRIRKKRIPDRETGLIEGLPRWCYNIIPDLVKSSKLKQHLFDPDLKSYELFEHQIRLFKTCTISFVPEVVSVFRDHDGLRTSSFKLEKIAAVDRLFEEHYDYLNQERKFASKLRLSQGIYDQETQKKKYKDYFLKAIRLDALNPKAYYYLIQSYFLN